MSSTSPAGAHTDTASQLASSATSSVAQFTERLAAGMKLDPEKQHDEFQQMSIWPEEVSNEGHVYAALGVDPMSLAFEERMSPLAFPAQRPMIGSVEESRHT